MAIKKLIIENFKGIKDETEIDLKPVNLIIGPNSSGKSSILHALALLKQTILNPTEKKALLLDYETALVHLGRYEDVVFGHELKNKIGIGVDFTSGLRKTRPTQVRWRFRGTKRTQEIFTTFSEITMGNNVFTIRETSKDTYLGSRNKSPIKLKCLPQQNFIFNPIITHAVTRRANFSIEFNKWYGLYRMFQKDIVDEINKIHYLGPFRQPPRRRYDTRGSVPSDVGVSGELAVPLLVNELIRTRKRPNIQKVLTWLNDLNLSKILKLNSLGASDIFKIELKTHNEAPITTPVDVGYGVSQVLPVLTQCAFLEEGSTLLLEQPELHLHPKIQRNLANILIETALKTSSTLMIESHSERLVGGMLEAIRKNKLSKKYFNLISVKYREGSSKITVHKPDEYGDVYTNWQEGFC